MGTQNTQELWGDLRSLCQQNQTKPVYNDWGQELPADAHRALEAAKLLHEFPQPERDKAYRYARNHLARQGVDTELFRVAMRWVENSEASLTDMGMQQVFYARYYMAAREGFVGQVFTRGWQGYLRTFYYDADERTVYVSNDGYGSCSHCCAFAAASDLGEAGMVERAFRLWSELKVVAQDVGREDLRDVLSKQHEDFVWRYGEWDRVYAFYKEEDLNFPLEYNEYAMEMTLDVEDE